MVTKFKSFKNILGVVLFLLFLYDTVKSLTYFAYSISIYSWYMSLYWPKVIQLFKKLPCFVSEWIKSDSKCRQIQLFSIRKSEKVAYFLW